MATVYKRASAKRDLVEDNVYLAEHPGMGTALSLHDPKLTGLRKGGSTGLKSSWSSICRDLAGFLVVRVLHAAQDWWGLLGIL